MLMIQPSTGAVASFLIANTDKVLPYIRLKTILVGSLYNAASNMAAQVSAQGMASGTLGA